ncbi:dipeptide/oligopeptide/nickel ABC transporter permease/ATP-binding protein [Agreia pratensis]|nr:dipeptide/oligopeptide/nickel ABC transporter permease/ATP-binding protein [Agreia pratensis]
MASVGIAARPGSLRRFAREPLVIICLSYLALVVAAAALASVLTSQDPLATSLADSLAPPSSTHPLGGDGVGRDVWAQLLYGARTSLIGTLIVVVVSHLIGLPSGIIAGYYRGWFDSLGSWLSGLLMALPGIIVLIVAITQFGRSTELAMTVFGVLISPAVFRLARASSMAVRSELFIDAAQVAGLKDLRIMARHILPVVIRPIVIQASQLAGVGLVVQAGLGFLGFGSANQASWGGMLSDAFQNVYSAPQLLITPSAAIILTITAFGLLGNGISDALSVGTATPSPQSVARRKAKTAPKPASSTTGTREDNGLLLEVEDLRVAYAGSDGVVREVVHGIDLTVSRGEVLGLVGESGSGKSQTAFAILGLLPSSAQYTMRTLTFDGADLLVQNEADINRLRGLKIGYIPQEPMSNLDPAFTIGSQLTEPMRHHLTLSRTAARAEALRLLSRVGIVDPERVFALYPHQISGGMAQRVLIAGAVSCNPDLLIADEPTTALDVTVQAEVLDLIRDLQAERNLGVILVTHDLGVVADVCDRVAVMKDGQILETATAEKLFTAPTSEYTRRLLAATLEDAPMRKERS